MLGDGKHVVDEDYCGSCYGAAEDGVCCNTCEDVKNAYRKKGWSFDNLGQGIAQVPPAPTHRLYQWRKC